MGYPDGRARRAGIGRISAEQFSEGLRCLCEPLVAEPGESEESNEMCLKDHVWLRGSGPLQTWEG